MVTEHQFCIELSSVIEFSTFSVNRLALTFLATSDAHDDRNFDKKKKKQKRFPKTFVNYTFITSIVLFVFLFFKSF